MNHKTPLYHGGGAGRNGSFPYSYSVSFKSQSYMQIFYPEIELLKVYSKKIITQIYMYKDVHYKTVENILCRGLIESTSKVKHNTDIKSYVVKTYIYGHRKYFTRILCTLISFFAPKKMHVCLKESGNMDIKMLSSWWHYEKFYFLFYTFIYHMMYISIYIY